MYQARAEVRELYGMGGTSDICDIIVSCDGTWQLKGFSSLFGAVLYMKQGILSITLSSVNTAMAASTGKTGITAVVST